MKPLLLLSFIFLANLANAQVGSLDSSFGVNGIEKLSYVAKTPLVSHVGESYGLQVTANSFNPTVRVYKYLSSGLPDATYGTNGYTVLVTMASPTAAIQNDGKILVFGSIRSPYINNIHDQIRAVRFNIDGSLDNTFGINGITEIAYNNNLGTGYSFISKLVTQGDNVLLYGYVASAAFGFSADYVNTFNSTGTARYTISPYRNTPPANYTFGSFSASKHVAFSENKMVVAGLEMITNPNFPYNATYGNYLSKYVNNTPNITFGVNGRLPINFSASAYENMTLDAQDRIIIVNSVLNTTTGSKDFIIRRLDKNGYPDASFNGNGTQTTDIAAGDSAYAVVLQGDKIIVAGSSNNINTGDKEFALARYNDDGSLDQSFGDDGVQTTGMPGSSFVLQQIKIEGDRLIAKGTVTANAGTTYKVTAAYLLKNRVTLTCVANQTVPTDKGLCSAIVNGVDPTITGANGNVVHYTMAGATNNSGIGSVSGKVFNKGVTTVTYAVANEPTIKCSFTVTVQDNEAPEISRITATPKIIWPANNKMVSVYLTYKEADNCGIVRKVVTVTSNDTKKGISITAKSSDWMVVNPTLVKVRAKKSARGEDRIYTISVTAYDAAGNKSETQKVTVVVPHDNSVKKLDKDETTFLSVRKDAIGNENVKSGLAVKILSNPSAYYFTLLANSNSDKPLTIKVADVSGRLLFQKAGIAANGSLTFGNEFAPGIYFAEVRQGDKKVVLKLVRL